VPSFILRNLDPDFWQRVQRKAADQGTTVKDLILRLLAAWLAAAFMLLTVGCAETLPTAPESTIIPPRAGVPARLDLSASPGVGAQGGTGSITARVLDGLAAAVPGVTVTFSASSGTLDAAAAVTDGNGIARTTIAGPTGVVQVAASIGTLESKTQLAIQPPPPPATTPPTPFPTPQPPATPTPTPTPTPAPLPEFSVKLTNNFASVPVGGAIDFVATVTNPGGETITSYEWDLDDTTGFEFTTVVPTKQSKPMTKAGRFTATVKVTSASNRTALGTVTYVVTN